jgi:hypothetical protein
VEDFRENLRARLYAEVENERWKILLSQKKLIEEYGRVVEQLRESDAQIVRLLGPPPSEDICPQCHYLSGFNVSLVPAIDENRAGDGIMTCPGCGLVLPP